MKIMDGLSQGIWLIGMKRDFIILPEEKRGL